MTRVLETRQLDQRFGGLHVTRGVSLQIDAGDRLALIGPNGAGKTTFVKLVSGVLAPSSGQVITAEVVGGVRAARPAALVAA